MKLSRGPKNLFSCNVVYIIFWTFCDEKQFAKFLSLALSGERHKGRSWDQQSLFRHQGQGGEVNTANKKQSSFDQLFSVLFSIVQCTIIPRFSWQHCLPIIFVGFFIFWKGAVPKPSDWISLFVCLFVCLFVYLFVGKERLAGSMVARRRHTQWSAINLLDITFFPFWFRL